MMSTGNSRKERMPDKYDFYLKLMKISLENANQFRKDALFLREKLSFGHAYSLAILGFEELAKCWFAFGLFIGEFQDTDEIVTDITRDHLVKQMLGWQTLAMVIMNEWFEHSKFVSEIQILLQQLTKGEISLKSYTKRFFNYAELESKSS